MSLRKMLRVEWSDLARVRRNNKVEEKAEFRRARSRDADAPAGEFHELKSLQTNTTSNILLHDRLLEWYKRDEWR